MITVLGSINMDLIANVARLPKPGETISGDTFTTAAGGKGANQALAARRAGSDVVMAGAVGDDEFSAPALNYLRDAGTGLSAVKTAPGATGVALIFVGGDGENMISIVPGANGTVTPEDAERCVSTMSRGDYLMLQFEITPAAIERALTAAKKAGIKTVFNIAPISAGSIPLAKMADIVIANETEFETLTGKSDLSGEAREKEMMKLYEECGQTIIVTLGGDGVVAVRDGEISRAAGLKIDPVDTVGAGDTFCGYLVASLDQGLKFPAALKRAAVAGSLACLKRGAQASIPWAKDVKEQLDRQ